MAICCKDIICNLFNPNDGCLRCFQSSAVNTMLQELSLSSEEVSVMRIRAYVICNVCSFNRAKQAAVQVR